MDALLNRVRDVAREDDMAIAGHAADLAPLSQETRGNITRLILEQQAREKPQKPREETKRAGDDLAVRRALRSRRTFFTATGGLVAAAAALLVWMRPGVQGPTLPVYVVAASGGVMDVRGAPAGASESIALGGGDGPVATAQRLRARSELLVTCRPDTAVAGPVTVRAFVVRGPDGAPQVSEVRPRVQVAATGAVELRIAGAEFGPARGQATLRVAVGRPDTVRALDGQAAVAATGGDGVRWLAVPLDLETGEP